MSETRDSMKRKDEMMYITKGSVRGNCGHRHRTLTGAVRCLLRDQSGARKQGGYSDREIRYADGRRLSESDHGDAMTIEYRLVG